MSQVCVLYGEYAAFNFRNKLTSEFRRVVHLFWFPWAPVHLFLVSFGSRPLILCSVEPSSTYFWFPWARRPLILVPLGPPSTYFGSRWAPRPLILGALWPPPLRIFNFLGLSSTYFWFLWGPRPIIFDSLGPLVHLFRIASDSCALILCPLGQDGVE